MDKPKKLQHIAIIMDGNRRWATEKGLPKFFGHTEGAKNIKKIAKAVLKHNIPYLTMYTLSTENLKNRSEEELKHLFSLFKKLADYIDYFTEDNVKLQIIGDMGGLPEDVQKKLTDVEEKTKNFSSMTMSLAVNYGGRDEITRAVKNIVKEKIKIEDITEKTINDHLDTKELPDIDLVIRTGKQHRLSNFLPWQSTYAELYFTQTYWPAFSNEELDQAVEWFYEQKRNKGK